MRSKVFLRQTIRLTIISFLIANNCHGQIKGKNPKLDNTIDSGYSQIFQFTAPKIDSDPVTDAQAKVYIESQEGEFAEFTILLPI